MQLVVNRSEDITKLYSIWLSTGIKSLQSYPTSSHQQKRKGYNTIVQLAVNRSEDITKLYSIWLSTGIKSLQSYPTSSHQQKRKGYKTIVQLAVSRNETITRTVQRRTMTRNEMHHQAKIPSRIFSNRKLP